MGGRVRDARKSRGFSRRVLSERSGVSQRYLASLETGTGNISIVLLYKVAAALSCELEWFISEDESSVAFLRNFHNADDATRQKIQALLGSPVPSVHKQKRVCLIGLRGAGKSTAGKLLAESFGCRFVELNEEVERHSGLSVAEVMDLYGQAGYRRLERQSIEELVQCGGNEPVIIAASGGVVSDFETYGLLLARFHTVWLKASASDHMQRVIQQGDNRPMAGNPQAMADLEAILIDRESSYAKADSMVYTSGKTIEDTVSEIGVFVRRAFSPS